MDDRDDIETRVRELRRQLCQALAEDIAIDKFLDGVLMATGARATGLWGVVGEELRQIGFRAVEEMDDVVKHEFAAATLVVPLSDRGLGIVKAALLGTPAVASVDDSADGLGASASWLRRFGAKRSLAVPLMCQARVVGVLAISTAQLLDPQQSAWRILIRVAEGIGDAVRNWSQRESHRAC